MTRQEYSEYKKRISTTLDGLDYVSIGPCPSCVECLERDNPGDTPEEWHDMACEPRFSGSSCGLCRSTLCGDRYSAHALSKDINIVHFDVCADCHYYVEHGRLDDRTMMDMK